MFILTPNCAEVSQAICGSSILLAWGQVAGLRLRVYLSLFLYERTTRCFFSYTLTAPALRNVVIGIYVIFINCIRNIPFSIIIYLKKTQVAQFDCDINISFIHLKNVISERNVGWKCSQQPGKHMIGVGKQHSGYLHFS